jgi:signal peptidase I
MSPTVLLADPSVRLAGVRTPRVRVARRPVRWRWVLVAWLVTAAACGLAFLQTWPPLATVMSGSMAPTIGTGDVVLLKRLERPARVGDVVSIPVPDEARARFGYPPVVIHRIVAIDEGGIVSTKGDARKQRDPFTVPSSTLTTRVVATVPAAGRVLSFLGSPLGLLWLGGGAVLLLGLPLLERYRDAQRRVAEDRDGLQAAVAALTSRLAAEAAERERLAAEAHRQALAESAERERRLADAAAERERLLLADARAAREQMHSVSAALTRHLEELPALLERAIADAVATTAPPPPAPAAVSPTPDLLGCFVPAARRKLTPARFGPGPWDAPPRDLGSQRRFAPPVNTFFA